MKKKPRKKPLTKFEWVPEKAVLKKTTTGWRMAQIAIQHTIGGELFCLMEK